MGCLRCVFLTAALVLKQLFGPHKPFSSQTEIWAARGELEKPRLSKEDSVLQRNHPAFGSGA